MTSQFQNKLYGPPAAVGLVLLLGLPAVFLSRPVSNAHNPAPLSGSGLSEPSGLPLPSGLSTFDFEEKLFEFLNQRRYVALGWRKDKGVRDTGPYIDGKYFGTHPAVRVYYSPGVIRWLANGRIGTIADGEMIVKEQYAPPAARHPGKSEEELWASLESWTVMVRDSAGSRDGWFWSNPTKGQCAAEPHRYPFDYPSSGFGLYCIRCHAATASPGGNPPLTPSAFTFASLRNVEGFSGSPLVFRVDDSWRKQPEKKEPSGDGSPDAHPRCVRAKPASPPAHRPNQAFLDFFHSVKPAKLSDVSFLPPQTHDWVTARPDRSGEFLTSNQCMSCHAGLLAPFGPSMFVPTEGKTDYGAPGWDVSPFGEWAWTPMGLAGRDPVFHAQLEHELHCLRQEFASDPGLRDRLSAELADACLRCHGVMGKHQLEADRPGGKEKISVDHALAVAETGKPATSGDARYGALARDGVSCAVCHRMTRREQPADDRRPYLQYFLESSISGNIQLGKPGEIYGPFVDKEIAPHAMQNATGWTPKQGEFLKSSQLCGSCHTIALPALDKPHDPRAAGHRADELSRADAVPSFRNFHHHVEQATYLEWLNSEYENEINQKNPRARTCQDCHMSAGLKDDRHGINLSRLQTRIAAIQDTTYPEAENLAPHDKLNVRVREDGYRRHNFAGLNVFLLELFDQFDDVLGVRKTDFMTGSKETTAHARENFVRTAREDVADLEVSARRDGSRLEARVVVRNKAGHRFPSGVGFRRAFLELAVVRPPEATGVLETVWASGRTNALGILIDADGRPLPTEFFERDPATGRQRYQGHHRVIASPDQVQIYERLLYNAKGEFTTRFVAGCDTVKDNRLLPRGWKKVGPGPALAGKFLEATHPDPETAKSSRYQDGSGSDEVVYRIDLPPGVDPSGLRVRATLYYQAFPPYYLQTLFNDAPDGPATRRLHYLCSHLNLKGTPIEDWKLRIAAATCPVP